MLNRIEANYEFSYAERDRPWVKTVSNIKFKGLGRVQTIIQSPDKTLVVSVTFDHEIQVRDVETKSIISIFRGHQGWVSSLAVSLDNKLLLSGSFDRTICIWDLQLLHKTVQFNINCYVMSVCFSNDSQHIAAGCSDGTMRIWSLQNDSNFTIKPHRSHVINLKFFNNDCQIVTLGNDSTCNIYNFPELTEMKKIKILQRKIISVEFIKNVKFIIISFVDASFRVYRLL